VPSVTCGGAGDGDGDGDLGRSDSGDRGRRTTVEWTARQVRCSCTCRGSEDHSQTIDLVRIILH